MRARFHAATPAGLFYLGRKRLREAQANMPLGTEFVRLTDVTEKRAEAVGVLAEENCVDAAA